jgi:PDZ domain/Aspartyl protease
MMRVIALLLAIFLSGLVVSTAGAAPNGSALSAAQIDKVLTLAHGAAGGASLDGFAAMTQSGTLVQNGGAPSTFDSTIDLRNGYSRTRLVVGPATLLQGYDGTQWSATNGSLSIVSLPAFVADAVTQAYLNGYAFFRPDERSTITSGQQESVDGRPAYVLHAEPAGGSPADLCFDAATYRLVKIVAKTAQGVDTTTNSNFKTVDGVPVAMRSVDVDPAGTTSIATLSSVRFAATVDAAELARPAYVSQGTLAAPTSVPFDSDVAGVVGHIVLPVVLDGKQASLVFDSGGSNFLVPAALQRLGLQASGGLAAGGAGSKEQMTSFAAVSSVDLGGARLAHQSFIVTPLPYPLLHPRRGIALEGLIGFEYLANFRVIVRYGERRIDVTSFNELAPSGGVTLPFKSDGRHAYVLATIDGVAGYYILDTGSSGGITLNAPFVRDHHLFPNGGLVYQSPGGVGGGFPALLTAAKSFAFAGSTFDDVPVTIPQVSTGFFATRGVAGNLGSGFLSRFTVVFDYKAQTVTFIPNRDVAMPFRSDHVGLSLDQSDPSAFQVRKVVPGSPASDAGIAPGDRITAFAGQEVSSGFGLGDIYPYNTGAAPFAVTVSRAGVSRTLTLTPRVLLPPAQ